MFSDRICPVTVFPDREMNDMKKEHFMSLVTFLVPILVALRSKAWVCGRSLAGIVGAIPARSMEVWLLCVSVVR